MSTLRIERVPIQVFNLGFFGFDHLQLVLEQDRSPANQAAWYVIEGLVHGSVSDGTLGVLGTDGQTTLSQANGFLRDLNLIRAIGTPETRGSVIIETGGAGIDWQSMAAYGSSIDSDGLPYVGYGFPGAVFPTINSTSVAASLLFHIGIDINHYLPAGLGFSPGTTTLVGTSHDDTLEITNGFNALVGGGGNFVFANKACSLDSDGLFRSVFILAPIRNAAVERAVRRDLIQHNATALAAAGVCIACGGCIT